MNRRGFLGLGIGLVGVPAALVKSQEPVPEKPRMFVNGDVVIRGKLFVEEQAPKADDAAVIIWPVSRA